MTKTYDEIKAAAKIRHLEMQHAISCLERAWQLMDDQMRHDIERVLNNARDVLELLVGDPLTRK